MKYCGVLPRSNGIGCPKRARRYSYVTVTYLRFYSARLPIVPEDNSVSIGWIEREMPPRGQVTAAKKREPMIPRMPHSASRFRENQKRD